MFKKIILSFFVLMTCIVVQAVPLQAGIKYTEASARIEAFKDIQTKIQKDFYRDYLKDPDYKENKQMIEDNSFEIDGVRALCPFYLKKVLISYAVAYSEKPYFVPYYNSLGSLIRFDIITSDKYPRKTLGYSRYGNLLSVIFEVNEEEQFVYNENGKLIAHWQNNEMKNKHEKIPKLVKITRGKQEK